MLCPSEFRATPATGRLSSITPVAPSGTHTRGVSDKPGYRPGRRLGRGPAICAARERGEGEEGEIQEGFLEAEAPRLNLEEEGLGREGLKVLLRSGARQKSTCARPAPGMQLVKPPTATSRDCRCPGGGRGLRVNLQRAIKHKQRIPGMQRPPGRGRVWGGRTAASPCSFTPAAWAGAASTQVAPEQGAAAAFWKESSEVWLCHVPLLQPQSRRG